MTRFQKVFANGALDSRIQSANVQKSEKWLGIFTGQGLIAMIYTLTAGTFLNVFYTDVVKISGLWGGLFLTILPIASKIFDAITNIIMGQIIDKTKTRQGKARPWILISAILVPVTGLLLYLVPKASQTVQALWIAVSYNLYYAFAYTIYNMSNSLIVPLSTRNRSQRDGLALISNVAVSVIPGAVIYMLVPLVLLPWLGVDQSRWATVMGTFSVLMLPAILLQYFFTKERITEELADQPEQKTNTLSLKEQLKACLKSRSWVIIMLITAIWQLQNNFYSAAVVYYSNWVVGTYNDGFTLTLVNAVGQFPLGVGIFLLWPVVKKTGKRKALLGGMIIATIFSLVILIAPKSIGVVLGALFFKSFGMLPTYLLAALLAEAMDHVEWVNGFRCDGISASIYSIIATVGAGFAMGFFNLGLAASGYVPPAADGSWVAQSEGTQFFFIAGFALIPAISYALVAILIYFFDAEKLGDRMRADITARHKAEAEARGEVYLSIEEKAAIEEAEQSRIAEEKRIEELKAKCEKKGLSFEDEEAKYQARLAEKKAKAEAKAAKRKK